MRVCIRLTPSGKISEGSCLAFIPDGAIPGKREAPENGYVWIELTGKTLEECGEFAMDSSIPNPEWSVVNTNVPTHLSSGDRLNKINLDSPLPMHRRARSRFHKNRIGKTIRKHLMNMVVPVYRSGIIVTED